MQLTRRGMSMLELLIAGGLFLVVLSVVFGFLIPSFRNSSRNGARIEMQQQASLAMDRLMIDLERSAPAAVTLLPSPAQGQASGVAIQRLRGFSGGGLQEWESELVLYYWLPQSQRLKREIWRAGLPPALPVVLLDTRPSRITRQDLVDVINDGSASEQTVATGVIEFEVALAKPPAMQPFTIGLTLARTIQGRPKPETFELRRSVTLRNDW